MYLEDGSAPSDQPWSLLTSPKVCPQVPNVQVAGKHYGALLSRSRNSPHPDIAKKASSQYA